MRCISLVVALVAVIAASGCGGDAKPRSSSTAKGTAGSTFTVTVNMQGHGTFTAVPSPAVAVTWGYRSGQPANTVSADFPSGTKVDLTYNLSASWVVGTAPNTTTYNEVFNGWYGDCSGKTCSVTGNADKYVVAYAVAYTGSTAPTTVHPNWVSGTDHGTAYLSNTLSCTDCHGINLQGMGIAPSCSSCHGGTPTSNVHPYISSGANCRGCHISEGALWASAADLHSASASDILLNTDHNTNELLVDQCLQCHSMFQRPLGIAYFVTPINQTGPWSLNNPQAGQAWQATKCEVCHDPASSGPAKLSKYGAVLDRDFTPAYVDWTAAATAYPDLTWLTTPYQWVFNPTSASYVQTTLSASALGLAATKVCYSCHDPDDQGDPSVPGIVGGVNYGPQGGDSRAFVTASHAGMTCIDCHTTHDFTPLAPTSPGCSTSACHGPATPVGPGVVHVNHLGG